MFGKSEIKVGATFALKEWREPAARQQLTPIDLIFSSASSPPLAGVYSKEIYFDRLPL